MGPASPAKGAVRVYLPAGLNPSAAHTVRAPLVVALHGWNGKAEDWDRPEITGIADRFGLILACPSMGRTVYESRFYPETRARWGPMPGAVFLTDVLLPFLRTRLPVRHDRSGTAIIGVSTGGRGAVVAALRSKSLALLQASQARMPSTFLTHARGNTPSTLLCLGLGHASRSAGEARML